MQKGRHLGCLLAESTEMQTVLRMESGSEHRMEMRWAYLSEIDSVQLTENLKETRLAGLSAELMVLMTESCWAEKTESGWEQLMDLMMELS